MRIASDRAGHALSRTFLSAMVCGSLLMACSDSTEPTAGRAITELKGPATTVNVGQGFFAKTIVSIKRSSSFTGAVQLSAVGLPQGMLVSFAPATLDGVSELSEMTVSAQSTVTPGAHSFTVRATAEGVEAKTLNVQVMVTVPAITIAATTAAPTVPLGGTNVIPVTITREGGFTGVVGLSVLGLPAGVTASFSPPAIQVDGTTSTLTLSAPLTAQLGTKSVTLRASPQGLADKTIPMELTVGPATAHAVLVSASPFLLTVTGGQTVESTISVQRFAGFNGVVDVTVGGLPPELDATADPIAAGSNTTTLRISGKAEEFGINYIPRVTPVTLSVRANAPGIPQASTAIGVSTWYMPQFNLLFDQGPGQLGAQLTKEVTISRGGTASTRLNISRFQYTLPVALSVSGVAANVTTNLPTTMPTSETSQEFFVIVNVGADAVPGVYNLVIRGESSTPLVRTATIILTVN